MVCVLPQVWNDLTLLHDPFSTAGNTSPGAMCSPWKVPVEVDSPDHRFQPYYVEMHRCHGGCRKSPNSCECIAASEQPVKVSVYDVAVGPTHKVVQNHTSCQCRCKASLRETCKKGGHTWNENTCTCSCPAPPSGTSCKPSQSWDPRRCQCVCSKQSPTCSRGMLWNKSICECTCSIETFARCSRTGKATNMKTCQCQTQPAVTNQLGSRKCELNVKI